MTNQEDSAQDIFQELIADAIEEVGKDAFRKAVDEYAASRAKDRVASLAAIGVSVAELQEAAKGRTKLQTSNYAR